MEKALLSQTQSRLVLYRDEFFRGRRFVLNGNVAVRNLERRFDDIESLRFRAANRQSTLVLFSRTGFRGRYRVIRGSTRIADLDDYIRGESPESLIASDDRLSNREIDRIRRTGRLPRRFTVL